MPEFSPAESMRTLVEGDAGLTAFTFIVGHGGRSQDRQIVFTDTGGLPSNPKWLIDFPTVQVITRDTANGYKAAWNAIKVIKDLCLGLDGQTINGDRWNSVTIGSDITFLGRDANNRPEFSLNFRLIIEPQTNSNTNRLAL